MTSADWEQTLRKFEQPQEPPPARHHTGYMASRYSSSSVGGHESNFADMLAETLSNEAASAERRRDQRQVQGYSAIREKVR